MQKGVAPKGKERAGKESADATVADGNDTDVDLDAIVASPKSGVQRISGTPKAGLEAPSVGKYIEWTYFLDSGSKP